METRVPLGQLEVSSGIIALDNNSIELLHIELNNIDEKYKEKLFFSSKLYR